MRTGTLTLLCLACFISTFASANSVQSFPINGVADEGQPGFNCCFSGDFHITGPGLSLFQGTPDGPNEIGLCRAGSTCDFSYSIGTASFCFYCLGFSGGSVGNTTADFLDVSLIFRGSGFYSGGDSITLPMTVSGTIIGYKLVNCDTSGGECSLGPVAFKLRIVGHGDSTFTMQPEVGGIAGVFTTFTGTATLVPEPISLVLTGTGLLGIWFRRKTRAS